VDKNSGQEKEEKQSKSEKRKMGKRLIIIRKREGKEEKERLEEPGVWCIQSLGY